MSKNLIREEQKRIRKEMREAEKELARVEMEIEKISSTDPSKTPIAPTRREIKKDRQKFIILLALVILLSLVLVRQIFNGYNRPAFPIPAENATTPGHPAEPPK